MKLKLLILLFFFVFSTTLTTAQNLLDTSTWTVGSGSVSGFGQNGATSENSREFGTNPFGGTSILWKGGNDAASDGDGGWNASYQTIDNAETYRLVVWIKKTNSNNGSTYFGCQQWQSGSDTTMYDFSILNLNGSLRTNPYFWVGDLPQLNKWYMLVAYVHSKNYTSNLSYGGIYDPTTGTKVANISDFKFAASTTKLRHRAYLYYDTNTADRQFFYAPRMEMVDGNEPSVASLLGLDGTDTNLLSTASWTVGCGSVTGFGQNGATSENCRELGRNHIGEEVVLWKGGNDSTSDADGGWNTGWISGTDHNTTYRFSVWLKKTNSTNGHSYLGFYANNSGSLTLSGTYNSNPYFWVGDLPKLNRWYLVVGYLHKSSYSSSTNLGRIFDGVTGEEVSSITDYKQKNSATALRHRSYLYYDTNTSDRQYFWAPRIDPITGNEPTIKELLHINENSKLIFSYDAAGNQKQRFYCQEDGFCSPVAPSNRSIIEEGVKMKEEEGIVVAEQTDVQLPGEETDEETDILGVKHSVFPNPTNGQITIQLSGKDFKLTNSISIYNVTGSLVQKININNPTAQMQLDISSMPSGVYLIHMHFTNGTVTTEQIIKN
ncbi:T9SS type A sorting domain-containing protein [Kordia jejudonensis]|uniref:T9SS type A sorting domain-containing protein n=1 Tax=Kordia jejudonensis TaxID=1348245 RepID=UPI0006296C90|nr:T9SS type A sorting domain-containing protein [Kordia jejudonensis]